MSATNDHGGGSWLIPEVSLNHTDRELPDRRPVDLRLLDWKEVYTEFDKGTSRRRRAAAWTAESRSATTAVRWEPVPEWNDLVYRIVGAKASNACTPPTTFRSSPVGCARRRARPRACSASTSHRHHQSRSSQNSSRTPSTRAGRPGHADRQDRQIVAVIGSGPAVWPPHSSSRAPGTLTVFEAGDRIGGLLRYGIPEFKMEKRFIDRRLEQMQIEGTVFRPTSTSESTSPSTSCVRTSTPSLLAVGSTIGRDLPIPGRELSTASIRRWSSCRRPTGAAR